MDNLPNFGEVISKFFSGEYPYFVYIYAVVFFVMIVGSISFSAITLKKRKNQRNTFLGENQDAVEVYTMHPDRKGGKGTTEILAVDNEYSYVELPPKRNQFGYYIQPGEHIISIQHSTTVNRLTGGTSTTTIGPKKLKYTFEPNRKYFVSFNTNTEKFTIEKLA